MINPELLTKLSAFQNAIWESVSLTTSEALNQLMSFADPLTTITTADEAFGELSQPAMVVNFAFSDTEENVQTLMLPQDSVMAMLTLVESSAAELDEAVTNDLRPLAEGLVQGICMAVGNARNDTIVATGLSIKYQVPASSQNLEANPDCVQTNVAISADGVNATLIWIADESTIRLMLGEDGGSTAEAAPDAEPVFETVEFFAPTPSAHSPRQEDTSGLNLLMDIPLEISVELGRVRMPVREVVELGAGSIVEIDKAAGEPVDVLVNGRLVARGEVVVIEDNFGVRITEILTPQERLHRLNEAA